MNILWSLKWVLKYITGSTMPQIIKKYKNFIEIDKSVLFMTEAKIEFRQPREAISLKIGKDSLIGCGFVYESEQGLILIGERTFINSGTILISRSLIEIGNDVTIAWGVTIYDHDAHSLDWRERRKDLQDDRDNILFNNSIFTRSNWDRVKTRPIKICDKVWIGFNVIILKGVIIGEGAVVAAGAVVTKSVPPYTVVAGNPARVVKNIEQYQ